MCWVVTDLSGEPKISENSVKNRPCLSNEVASLDDLAVRALIFERSGAVLIFASFLYQDKKRSGI